MGKIFFLAGIIVAVFVSCNRTDKELSFDCDSFEKQVFNYANAQKYSNEDLILGLPSAMRIHPDGFIILKDNQLRKQIVIIDLENGSTEQHISHGRGPLEVINVRDIAIHDGDIWVSGLQESKVIRLVLDRNTRKFEASETYDLSASRFFRATPLFDNRFLILSDAASGRRMEIVDDKGKTLKEVGTFPDIPMSENVKPNNAFLQSEITVSPDNNHLAVICKSIDYIDIYGRNMELQRRLRGPIGAEPLFIEIEDQGGKRFVQKPLFFIYETATSDNNHFFVSYKGVEVKTEKDFETFAHQIFSFDWTGKPLMNYIFDMPIMCFDVDLDNQKLYCITNNPEPEIVIFNL